jgi:hypothetical protein
MELLVYKSTLIQSLAFFLFLGVWWNWVHLVRRSLTRLLYRPQMMSVEQSVEWELAGETEVLGETCPSATLSTTNPTWLDRGWNPGRRGGKPATSRLSYGTADSRLGGAIMQNVHTMVTLGREFDSNVPLRCYRKFLSCFQIFKYCHVYEWLQAGFWLVNGFIGHLYVYTRLGTTSNYSLTANLHNSQINTAPAKPFSSMLWLHQPSPGNGF